MKGLILKDLYNVINNLGPALITTICVGLLLMIKGNPSLFVVGFAIAGGGICSTCMRMDETAQWTKYELITPISRVMIVMEKFVLLFMLTITGLFIGGGVSYIAGIMTATFNMENFMMYVAVAFSISMISGSFIIFFLFKYGMFKADFFIMICYIVPVALFVCWLMVLRYLGMNYMQGVSYVTITYMFPFLAVVITGLIAIVTVKVYKKKQF